MGLLDDILMTADPNFGSQYGDPDKSRVKPTKDYDSKGAWTHYTSGFHRHRGPDVNDPYVRVDAAMNHIHDRWGENYDEEEIKPFERKHGPRYQMREDRIRSEMHERMHRHHRHEEKETVIDTPAIQRFTPSDVEEVYGASELNLKLLKVASVRSAKLAKAIHMVNDLHHGIDLVDLMNKIPFVSTSFRKVLDEALNIEMKNYLAIIDKINKYAYGDPPQIEDGEVVDPPHVEEPHEPEPDPDIDVDINTPGDSDTLPAGNDTTNPDDDIPDEELGEYDSNQDNDTNTDDTSTIDTTTTVNTGTNTDIDDSGYVPSDITAGD